MKPATRNGVATACTLLALHCSKRAPPPATPPSAPLYVASDFVPGGVFTGGVEGPAVARDGTLFAVNFAREGTIGAVSPDGVASLFLTLPPGSTGNGLQFDRSGRLHVADYTGHKILRYTPPAWQPELLVHEPRMHQPNDLAITAAGVLYASDPDWEHASGQLWRIDPDGTATRIATDMGTTNGIEVSPDERTLYVNESVQRRIWAFSLRDGRISGKRLFYDFPDHGLDGMRCDAAGNLFVTRHGKGTVAILAPEATLLREVALAGKRPTNLAFGGPDGRTVYVTLADRGAIETFRAALPGRSFRLWQLPR